MKNELRYVKATFMALRILLQMQSLLINADNCRYEAVASNILKGFYFSQLHVLGYEHAGLYCTKSKTSCSWVNLIDIFHEAW